jgi:hypothetical protein
MQQTMTTSRSQDSIPTLPYKHRFSRDDFEGIRQCYYDHGFAIVEKVITKEMVEELKQSILEVVLPDGKIEPGATKYSLDFVERSPACAKLLTYRPYTDISRCLFGEEMSLNRSAAIVKNVGASVGAWHTDLCAPDATDGGKNAALNRGKFVSAWLYLNGTHPSRGGLAIIPDSHTSDWAGPEGFEFTHARRSFYRKGTEPVAYKEMDVPGMLPLFTEPGDGVYFAERTYHGVFPHNGDQLRLSCGISFRPGRAPLPNVWPLSESARRFIASCPKEVQHWVKYYPGLNQA